MAPPGTACGFAVLRIRKHIGEHRESGQESIFAELLVAPLIAKRNQEEFVDGEESCKATAAGAVATRSFFRNQFHPPVPGAPLLRAVVGHRL